MSINRICSVINCDKIHRTKGYCKKHYACYLRTGDPIPKLKCTRPIQYIGCSVKQCGREHYAKKMCIIHYQRYTRRGSTKSSYRSMVSRCCSPSNKNFDRYNALGVCDRWINGDGVTDGYGCFLKDMGERPDGMTLDRIDNDKGYSKDNCRWVTREIQTLNRGMYNNNKTGTTGVSVVGLGKRTYYYAYLKLHGELKLSKTFKNIEDAISARKEAEIRYFKPILDSNET